MKKILLSVLGLAAWASAFSYAKADDYFVDGVFAMPSSDDKGSPDDIANRQLKCALTPAINHKDGTYTLYFLDRDKFTASKEVSYIKSSVGTCSMDKATQLETCKSTEYSAGNGVPGAETINFYTTLTPQQITGHSFTSVDDFQKWKNDGSKFGDETFTQYHCDSLTEAMVTSHASAAVNSLSDEDTNQRLYFTGDPKPEDYAVAKDVLAALKK